MKNKSLDSFERLSKEVVTLALKLSAAKDKEDGAGNGMVQFVRHKLIVMLDSILESLSRVFRS